MTGWTLPAHGKDPPMPLAARHAAAIPAQRAPMTGSLTQPGTRRASCPGCGSSKVTELSMTLTDGSAVDFLSCHSCEHRRWTQGGEVIALPRVLAKTRRSA